MHRVPALGRGLPGPGLAVSEVRQVVGGDGPGQTGVQTCRRWLTMLRMKTSIVREGAFLKTLFREPVKKKKKKNGKNPPLGCPPPPPMTEIVENFQKKKKLKKP